MGLVTWLALLLLSGALSIIGNLVASELYDRAPSLARRIVKFAAGCITKVERKGHEEEWLAHLDECPGKMGQLLHALECILAAYRISEGPLTLPQRFAKRALDLSVAVLGGTSLLPVIAVATLVLRLESAGPVLFWQERIGRGGRKFWSCKLRTVSVDGQITPVGRFLRRMGLDELPQLWNIFVGDMSLVGPRPMAPIPLSPETSDERKQLDVRTTVKPGLTGLSQVRDYSGVVHKRRERLASDVEYVHSFSLWLDVKIVIQTVFVLVHEQKNPP